MKKETRPPNFAWVHRETKSMLWSRDHLCGMIDKPQKMWISRVFVNSKTIMTGSRFERQNAINLVEQFWRDAANIAGQLGLCLPLAPAESIACQSANGLGYSATVQIAPERPNWAGPQCAVNSALGFRASGETESPQKESE